VSFDAGTYVHGDVKVPRVDAIAAKDGTGRFWVALTNVDATRSATFQLSAVGREIAQAKGEMLAAPQIDSVNTFQVPTTVAPVPLSLRASKGEITVKLPPHSVAVVEIGK
jgi:alpha-N-arabinofuranosidase